MMIRQGTREAAMLVESESQEWDGFIGEDITYGLTKENMIYQNTDGSAFGAMYVIRIEGEDGTVRKEYARDGVYVTSAVQEDNSLQLELGVPSEKGLEAAGTDQIRSNELLETSVQAVPISNSRTEEQMWLTFGDILLRTDPDIVEAVIGDVSEGVETILEWPEADVPQYYIYSAGRLYDIETVRNIAIQKAYDSAGTVLDDRQRCVWQRYNWPLVYRIDLNSLSPLLLAAASSGDVETFKNALPPGKKLFDMTGVVTTGLFYPLSRGCPVFVKLADGTSYLIVGYTEDDIIYWDAEAGTTAEIARSKADAIYRRGKYTFYTWEDEEQALAEAAAPAEEVPASPEEAAPAEEVPASPEEAAPMEAVPISPEEAVPAE